MLLANVIRNLLRRPAQDRNHVNIDDNSTLTVLNVGGGNKQIEIPEHYKNWRHLLLDIDPGVDVNIVLDARKLKTLARGAVDAVYCSHNLEHYYSHDVAIVLSGFLHILKPDGFVEIHVPDIKSVMKRFIDTGMDIQDMLYESTSGPISVHDVIYGWGRQIESTGLDFYAHKTGFTAASLMTALERAGFVYVRVTESNDTFALSAFAFKNPPTPVQLSQLGMSPR